MPECQAYGCKNKPHLCKGKSFFKIPDPSKGDAATREQAAKWLHFIGTGFTVDTFKFGSAKLVCEDHFTQECFTEDAHIKMSKLLGTTPRYSKVLVPGAVPTIFVHRPAKCDHGRAARLQDRTKKKEKKVSLYVYKHWYISHKQISLSILTACFVRHQLILRRV